MKNTLIVYQDELAHNYHANMLQHLNDMHSDGLDAATFTREVQRFAKESAGLTSDNVAEARAAFANAFDKCNTPLLLSKSDFEQITQWFIADQAFSIVLFTADGAPIGSFNQSLVLW